MRRVLLLLASLSFASVLPAQNIVTVADADADGPGNGNIVSNSAMAMSWTQTGSFSNVTVSAAIGANLPPMSSSSMRVFLTTQLGAGTTQGTHEIATAVLPVPIGGDPHPLLTLFSGLSLGPGTYFVSAFHESGGSPDWNFEPAPTVTSDVGSTVTGRFRAQSPFDGTYLPASTFSLLTDGQGFFQVTGEIPAPVAAPTLGPTALAVLVVAIALGALVVFRRQGAA